MSDVFIVAFGLCLGILLLGVILAIAGVFLDN